MSNSMGTAIVGQVRLRGKKSIVSIAATFALMAGICSELPVWAEAPSPDTAIASAEEVEPKWTISAGPMLRSMRGVSFQTGTHSTVPQPETGSGLSHVGSESEYANRQYDDGYVYVDAGSDNDGTTWHWGYDRASQVHGDNLLFHAIDGHEQTFDFTGDSGANWKQQGFEEAGMRISISRVLKTVGKFRLDCDVSVGWAGFSAEHGFDSTVTMTTYDLVVEDRYDLQGITPPTAPYRGTADGPGPLIDNRPSSRSVLREQTDSETGVRSIRESLNADLITLSIAPALEYRAGWWRLRAICGPTANQVKTDAVHAESDGLSGQEWLDHEVEREWRAGFFTEVAVEATFGCRLGAVLTGRYDWMGKVSGQVGPSSFEADLEGWSVAAGASLRF